GGSGAVAGGDGGGLAVLALARARAGCAEKQEREKCPAGSAHREILSRVNRIRTDRAEVNIPAAPSQGQAEACGLPADEDASAPGAQAAVSADSGPRARSIACWNTSGGWAPDRL